MKNKSYIGISFIILVFGIWVANELRVKFSKSDLLVMGTVPKFSLLNQNNKKITDKDYLGKVYVVEFFFTTCPTICPIMNQNMLLLQEEFYGNPNFGIASISIDSYTDTVEVLKEHAVFLGIKNFNWHLLTGDKTYVFNLAEKGFKLNAGADENEPGGLYHSGLFALIDMQGKIRCRKDSFNNPIFFYDGLEESGIKAIKEDIKKLLKE
ncbi:SCO family protein [uncultured Flavobacterium sp.]|uniref:SCO family protein n=1 Tax=uncultured Flavobacterium sp. TaxID=165435 RepID=UPI0030CA174D|tara:strand:+ start:127 stop:753 length:627 start_codon:yes stop_codon:yes gene_type:complete